MVTLGVTLDVPGVRHTSSSDTHTVCWAVESSIPTSGLRTPYVEWLLTSSDAPQVGLVLVRGIAKPNFSAYPSRMPNASPGMASVECFSKTWTMSDLPNGLIQVSATAYGRDGTTRTMEPTFFWNDKGGVDSRASTKVIYWAASTGNNANSGLSAGAAVKDLHKAIELACVANNCGGATIIGLESHAGGGGAVSPGNWHTGANDWLTIRFQNGATWSRIDPPNSQSADRITASGNGPGTYCRVRVQDYTILGTGPIFTCGTGVFGAVWREGGVHRSAYWDGSVSALCIQDSDEIPFDIEPRTATTSVHNSYCTGELRQGARIAYSAETLIFDCKVQGTLGGACYIQSWYQGAKIHSVACTEHSYLRNGTRGWACNQADGFTPLDPLEVQKIGSTMRVLGPSAGTPIPFSTQAAVLIGAPKMGLFLSGFTNPENNANQFSVLAAGITGGRHYVDLDNPACIAEGPTTGALLETAYNGVRYNIAVHTSYISFGTSRTGGDVFRDIALYDIQETTQSAFGNGADHDQLLIDNVRDAGGAANWNIQNSTITNSIIRRVSAPGSSFQPSAGEAFTSTQIHNCVWRQASSETAGAIANGLKVDSCHFITDNAGMGWHGSNATFGTWLQYDPTVAPYSMEPTAGNKGTGNAVLQNVAEVAWSPSNSTKGATIPVAALNWGSLSATDIDAAGAVTVTMTAAGTARLGLEATGNVAFAITATGTVTVATVAVTGGANLTVPLSLFANGFLETLPAVGQAASLNTQKPSGYGLAATVTPSDSGTPVAANALFVGGAGTLSVLLEDGSNISFTVPGFRVLPLRHVRVNSTGTTATSIVAAY